jgi:hypothetical protein
MASAGALNQVNNKPLSLVQRTASFVSEADEVVRANMNARIDRCLPWVLTLSCLGPCMCCLRTHPNAVPVSFDLVSEHVYSRALAVVTVTTFTWQLNVAFVVAFFMNPADFALCDGFNHTTDALAGVNGDWHNLSIALRGVDSSPYDFADILATGVNFLQSGVFAFFFALLIGLGNSRWHHRGWGFITPVIAAVSWAGSSFGGLRYCWLQLAEQGWRAQFWLTAAAVSNTVCSLLYLLQLLLAVHMLLARGCSSKRSSSSGVGDSVWCAAAEVSEQASDASYDPQMPHRPVDKRSLQADLWSPFVPAAVSSSHSVRRLRRSTSTSSMSARAPNQSVREAGAR